jgi:hypothetical protein
MGDIGELHQQVTIGTLPDDVLLKIFKFFIDEMFYDLNATFEEWCMLVHVCRRWRNLAFIYPCHLNLQLLCGPPKRSVERMLDIWPELPIFVDALDYPMKEDIDNVVAALRLNHQVSGIYLRLKDTSDPAWETFRPLMNHPFPALTYCWVEKLYLLIKNAISRSFLGGSAPSLQELHLDGVPFLTLPNLLLSAANLVSLRYLGTFLLKKWSLASPC